MRIGQALTDANTENEASAPCTTKRKPGRPPGSSKAPGKQTMPASPAPKKRRVSQPKPSPARRKSNAAKTTKKSDARGNPGIPGLGWIGSGKGNGMGWETGVVEHWQRLQHRQTP
uniref:Uncharacterized protein n=1 Tax=Brassica campestris TaxID=3711 RepID=M4F1D0_BRACM